MGEALTTSLEAVAPFRLDLTVTVLQRLPSNAVEVWDQGRYLRAFDTPRGPVAWVVTQPPGSERLRVRLHGDVGDVEPWRRRLARALGIDVDLSALYRRARAFPAVASMARAMKGVKPPRFQSLHESFASVLLFQQVSLASALAMLRRLVVGLSSPVEVDGVVLHPFPPAGAIAACSEAELRGFGLSGAKARALRAACEAVASGALDEAVLSALPSDALHDALLEIPGVGPWTAALLMLRGFGRLDRFPPGDVAADRLLRRLGSAASGQALLTALGDMRGMLYYLLFLDRMAREGRGAFTGAGARAGDAPLAAPGRGRPRRGGGGRP
jgi:DNA-3-methyladenine glycosylase II